MEIKEITQQIKKEINQNLSEILSGFFVMCLLLILVYRVLTGRIVRLPEYFSLVLVGCGLILVVGFEKRGKTFDRFVSMFVLFFLSVSFMLL